MLKFIAQRGLLVGVAALLLIAALVVSWKVSPMAGAATFVAGLVLLALARLFMGMRALFKLVWALKAENAALKARLDASDNDQRARLARAERRLAALAIKLDAVDDLDEVGG